MTNEQMFEDIKLYRKNTTDLIKNSTRFLIANSNFEQYIETENVTNCEDDICLIRNNIKDSQDRVLNKRRQ